MANKMIQSPEKNVPSPRDRYLLKYQKSEVEGECIILEIAPVLLNKWKFGLFIFLNIFAGIPLLLTLWYPWLKRYFYYDFCELQDCTDFWILNYDQEVTIVSKLFAPIQISELQTKSYLTFVNRYMTYVIDENKVVRVALFESKMRVMRILNGKTEGLSADQVSKLRDTYGLGTMVIQSPNCLVLFIKQILRPLYLFLIYSILLWIFGEQYYVYAGILAGISAIGLALNLYQMIKLNKEIFAMAYYQTTVDVIRGSSVVQVSSLDVVPGDIVFLKKAIKIPFDGVILEGSCLINQCSLTGESVPIVKKADTFERVLDIKHEIDKSSLIFQGTTIVQVNYKKKMAKFQAQREEFGIPVCVTRTNFLTTKGQLIRIILFPKEQENIFQRQSTKFLLFLFVFACASYGVLMGMIADYVQTKDKIIKFLDIIAITVPPSLPVSMTFGIIYAVEKMRAKSIFCISQNKVITGGIIEFCCFDKTGTLTEDFMDFFCLVPASNGKFHEQIVNNKVNSEATIRKAEKDVDLKLALTNMASNHSIIKIEETEELVGDPMEIKLFEFGNFKLNQSNSDPEIIFSFESNRNHRGDVYRRYEFDSDVQRMSVLVGENKSSYYAYSKGSPEMMLTIMNPRTVPQNYHAMLTSYASSGFRVLAIASRSVGGDILKLSRADVERDLTFNGFEVFENKLKPETKGAIKQLKDAAIGCVMITGDNSLTGANISYQCNISSRNKKMIICDYDKGTFVKENFNYVNRGGQADEPEILSETINQLQKSFESNNKISNSSVTPANISHIEIQLVEKNNAIVGQKSELELNRPKGEEFMEEMISIAEATNSQLCVTGKAFNEMFAGSVFEITELQRRFLSHVSVYARTKPNDKAKVVMVYQHTGLSVSMCGDGANDCGALKQADIGLSLSQAEASISAPFTSKIPNISSMVELIKECRAGLATNFSLFNIMAIYALIQYSSTIVTEKFLAYPSNYAYTYWDLCLNFVLILFIGNTATADQLSIDKPRKSLFSVTNLVQIFFMFGIQIMGQILIIVAYATIFNENNFYDFFGGMDNAIKRYDDAGEEFVNDTPECNAVFYFINPIYTLGSLAFIIAYPWRKPFYTNVLLMIVVVLTLGYSTIMVIFPEASWDQFLITYLPSRRFRGYIIGISYAFGLFLYFNQKLIMEPLSAYLVKKYPHLTWL